MQINQKFYWFSELGQFLHAERKKLLKLKYYHIIHCQSSKSINSDAMVSKKLRKLYLLLKQVSPVLCSKINLGCYYDIFRDLKIISLNAFK